MGERPKYCGASKYGEYALDGSGVVVNHHTCGRALCPYCSALWRANKVFQVALKVEAYAVVCGERPAVGYASLDPSEDHTLHDLRNAEKTINRRLKRGGVNASVKMFHAHRIKDRVKGSIRRILKDNNISSAGFWNFLKRGDSLDLINSDLGTNYQDIHSLLKIGLHDHLIMFPNYAKPTGDSSLMVRKGQRKDGSIKILESLEDTVKHVYYLTSHLGIPNKRFQSEPIKYSGDLHLFDPVEVLSRDELEDLKCNVLAFLNEGRERPLVYDEDKRELVYSIPEDEDEDKPECGPMSDFLAFSELDKLQVKEHINSTFDDPEHLDYMCKVV